MALIECPTCAEPVAWGAKACPHCGAVSPRVHGNRRTLVIWVVVLVVVTGLCYLAIDAMRGPDEFKLTNQSIEAP